MRLPLDLGPARELLRRSDWNCFPSAFICSAESVVKQHEFYAAAKGGDPEAAVELVRDVLGSWDCWSPGVKALLSARPFLLPVHALETEGMNVIPRVMASRLAESWDLPHYSGVVQVNRVQHTGATGYHRLAFPAVFDGPVASGHYLLIDDFIGQGGTLANLRGFVEDRGGTVMGAVSLTGKHDSAKLRVEPETVAELRKKHGTELEEWWSATFGYRFERLTESEARYLIRSDDADTIADRIAGARRAGD